MNLLKADDKRALITAVEVLRSGGIAVVPCDTIYGIVGKAPDTEQRIGRIKGRSQGKQFIRLICRPDVSSFTAMDIPPEILALWPAPLTIVVPAITGGTIALRMPDDHFLLKLIDLVGQPLFSTSVNREGQPYLRSIKKILAEFGESLDLVLAAGDMPEAVPSTIIDLCRRPYSILRPGACKIPDSYLSL